MSEGTFSHVVAHILINTEGPARITHVKTAAQGPVVQNLTKFLAKVALKFLS